MDIQRRQFDTLIIGAGGGGLRAALQLSQADARVAVVSKVFPTRSHTVAAQGGVNAALANVRPDNWHWHMFDTIKGSDYLGDQDAIEYMCRAAPKAVYELEHFGVPFSRLDNGTIYQRQFGGQSMNFGGEQAARTCAAADRTGHAILQSLYQQNIRAKTHFFDEYFAVDLLHNREGSILGALVLNIATGEKLVIEAKTTLLATGGAGQIFRTNTNALINTGDGMAMALRAGIPLQDMEFFQFHPTGIAGKGMLVSEGARGEGGYLVNGEGELPLSRLVRHLKDHQSHNEIPPIPGVVTRNAARDSASVSFCQMETLTSLPHPDYDDYFRVLKTFAPEKTFFPTVPAEISRGCWWRVPSGAGKHSGCAFCNLNLQWDGYRSKGVSQVVSEVDHLTTRYKTLSVAFMDNLLPVKESEEIFARLGKLNKDFRFFAEMRGSTPRHVLEAMQVAGMHEVQIGIEALSTRLLKKLNKGTSTIQNLEIMKHCVLRMFRI